MHGMGPPSQGAQRSIIVQLFSVPTTTKKRAGDALVALSRAARARATAHVACVLLQPSVGFNAHSDFLKGEQTSRQLYTNCRVSGCRIKAPAPKFRRQKHVKWPRTPSNRPVTALQHARGFTTSLAADVLERFLKPQLLAGTSAARGGQWWWRWRAVRRETVGKW